MNNYVNQLKEFNMKERYTVKVMQEIGPSEYESEIVCTTNDLDCAEDVAVEYNGYVEDALDNEQFYPIGAK